MLGESDMQRSKPAFHDFVHAVIAAMRNRRGVGRRVIGAGAMAAVLGVSFFPVASASATAIADPTLANYSRFRQELGMRSDLSYVEQLVATPGMDTVIGRWDAPFTVTEQAELAVREKIQLDRGPALALAEGYGNYGGYFSDPATGLDYLLLTSADAAEQAAIASRFPEPSRLRYIIVNNSLAHLQAAQHDLVNRMVSSTLPFDAVESRVDEPRNRLEVVTPDAVDYAAMGRELSAAYGVDVSVAYGQPPTPTSCTSRSNCGDPTRGGLSESAVGRGCTSGFMVYRGASRYVLSAGHCFHNGTSVTVGGQVSLNTENNKYQDIIPNPMIADVELLDIPSNLAGPYVFDSSVDNADHVVSSQGFDTTKTGDPICMSGNASGSISCGHVTSTLVGGSYPADSYNSSRTFDFFMSASYPVVEGDSGAPCYISVGIHQLKALGVQSGVDNSNNQALLSDIYYALFDGTGTNTTMLT